jgi:chaperonin GroEL
MVFLKKVVNVLLTDYICTSQIKSSMNQMVETSGVGYSPKNLDFGDTGRKKLINGVVKMSKAVKSTLGPGGNTVLIESPYHTHGITVTKDGVTVAKSIDLLDPSENLAVKMMKEAAEKTATSAGDGTTTAIVLTEGLVLGGLEHIKEDMNRTEVLRHMVDMSNKVVDKLRRRAKKVSASMLLDVASISANNDREIGKIISEVYKDVGKTGIVTVERSQTAETYAETTKGLKIDRGYLSPLFINDAKKDECVFEDVMVLVADTEISNILQIENVLKPIITEGKKLLIISPCNTNVVNTLAANTVKGNLKVVAIPPPNFGYKQHELMQDIAISVGATYFSEKTGDDLSHINYGDLGHAAKVIIGKDKTVIIRSSAKCDEAQVEERVAQLWDAHKQATRKADKDFILERIASLSGGIGVIFVGGQTDLEQKELYDRVDDAVCAVRSALEEGILPGAGKALLEESAFLVGHDGMSREYTAALDILRNALMAPFQQILTNAGLKPSEVYKGEVPMGHGYNLKTGEMGDLIGMGVIDPLKVTRSALQNAVSVATTILSTNAIITMARSYEQQ